MNDIFRYKVLTVYPNNAEQLQVLVNTEDMEDLTVSITQRFVQNVYVFEKMIYFT